MSDAITQEEFTRSMIPDQIKSEIKDLIEAAVRVGWTMYVTSISAVSIVSYDGRKRYHFYPTRKSANLNSLKRDIIKYADPVRLEFMQQITQNPRGPLSDAMARALNDTTPTVQVAKPEQNPPRQRREKDPIKPQKGPNEKPMPEAMKAKPKARPRTIVSSGPMLAKGGERAAYHSKTTIEEHWSDGSVTYRCAWPDCDFPRTEDRLAPSNHYRVHQAPVGPPQVGDYFESPVPLSAVYNPRQARIEALALYLQNECGSMAKHSDVARAALIWVNEQTRKNTVHSAEREEMPDEDILHRIRVLLGVAATADQEATIAALRAENERLALEALAATEAAERARDTLRTLSELAREADQDKS